ncbi:MULTISPECIES: carbonate dehydratase [Methylomonas]|uniref:Carbonic anhydrase n=2 Tax=Methylomonas TaxID=416 RepID=A0A126T760_9GAMM|nr:MULTISPECIES: carbonate dehydratase [Methylomonas]AMK77888.1 carbonic anhydrase [Methylomonas denitrificans]OAI04548.1 carbonic anhydrase [Methylomonas methanica]TCV87061.1 carbonic anhydrase [Methylomonas methanica]
MPNKLLLENKAWSQQLVTKNPDYFANLAQEQRPEFLWIGCADSRVPAETVVNAQPGEIFVHRNIANQVVTTDFNCLSVLQYAIEVLKVKHVIVCGHYGCGGVKAALQPQNADLAIANKWLMHIKDVYRLHVDELDNLHPDKQVDRMVELNIVEQVYRLAHTSIIQSAWKHGHKPTLRGWVYGLNDGLIQELIKLDHNTPINPIYRYAA